MADNTNNNEVRAVAKYVRIAPRKARLVVDQIRNKSVDRALELLQFNERAAAVDVAKVVRSAVAKYVRIAPRKARLVVDQIRNQSVEKALELLQFNNRAAAVPVAKVLRSAIANAENNHGLRGVDLMVAAAYVDEGPTLKRFRPRAKGSASRINKRTSHITVVVAPRKEA